jgi:hypothetical protein
MSYPLTPTIADLIIELHETPKFLEELAAETGDVIHVEEIGRSEDKMASRRRARRKRRTKLNIQRRKLCSGRLRRRTRMRI